VPPSDNWIVCRAKRSDGQPCKSPAIKGGRVCRIHGGSTRHIREAANRRLDELVLPAVSKIRTLMLRGESHAIQLRAATEILDRAGVVAPQQVEVDNQVTIQVSYADVELARQVIDQDATRGRVTYEALPEPSNGHEKTPDERGPEDRNGSG
jgi:hypothetical protein